MSTFQKIGIFTITIFSLMTLGFSIKCYQCNSAVDTGCADLKQNDTKSDYYKECVGSYGGEQPFCRIYVSHVIHIKEPEKAIRLARSCGWIRNTTLPAVDKCHKDDTDFIKKISCVCFKDACNEAGYLTSKISIPTILITVLYYFSW